MRFSGDTISTGLIIMSITFIYPILWLCEACYFVPVSLKYSRFFESAGRAWRWFKEYLFGVILHLFVVDGLKVIKTNTNNCVASSEPILITGFSTFFNVRWRFSLANWDHISWIHVVRTHNRHAREGELPYFISYDGSNSDVMFIFCLQSIRYRLRMYEYN